MLQALRNAVVSTLIWCLVITINPDVNILALSPATHSFDYTYSFVAALFVIHFTVYLLREPEADVYRALNAIYLCFLAPMSVFAGGGLFTLVLLVFAIFACHQSPAQIKQFILACIRFATSIYLNFMLFFIVFRASSSALAIPLACILASASILALGFILIQLSKQWASTKA